MSAQPPQTPPPLSLPQLIWRMTKAVAIWIVANLVTFIVVSFLLFNILGSMDQVNTDEAFTLAVTCAIPAALTVSSLIAGRKLIHLAWKRYRD